MVGMESCFFPSGPKLVLVGRRRGNWIAPRKLNVWGEGGDLRSMNPIEKAWLMTQVRGRPIVERRERALNNAK